MTILRSMPCSLMIKHCPTGPTSGSPTRRTLRDRCTPTVATTSPLIPAELSKARSIRSSNWPGSTTAVRRSSSTLNLTVRRIFRPLTLVSTGMSARSPWRRRRSSRTLLTRPRVGPRLLETGFMFPTTGPRLRAVYMLRATAISPWASTAAIMPFTTSLRADPPASLQWTGQTIKPRSTIRHPESQSTAGRRTESTGWAR